MKNDKLKYNKNNMKPSLKTKPHNYAYCFATNEQCPQRRECLHALVAELPMKASRTPEVVIMLHRPALHRHTGRQRRLCTLPQFHTQPVRLRNVATV